MSDTVSKLHTYPNLALNQTHATFREGQLEAILPIVTEKRRILLNQRTGWGKSMVYFFATKLLREEGAGPTLLISPLLALMRNQLEAARRLNLSAETINSSNSDDWKGITHCGVSFCFG